MSRTASAARVISGDPCEPGEYDLSSITGIAQMTGMTTSPACASHAPVFRAARGSASYAGCTRETGIEAGIPDPGVDWMV